MVALVLIVGVTLAWVGFSAKKEISVPVTIVNLNTNIDMQEDVFNLNQGDTIVNSISFAPESDTADCYVRARLMYSTESNPTSATRKYLTAINYEQINTCSTEDYKWTRGDDDYFYLTDATGTPLVVSAEDGTYTFCENVIFSDPSGLDNSISTPAGLIATAKVQGIQTSGITSPTVSSLSEPFTTAFGQDPVYGYIVIFDSGEGSDVPAEIILYPEMTVTQPEDPILNDLFFKGWFSDAECVDLYDFSSQVTHSLTLHALFDDDDSTLPAYFKFKNNSLISFASTNNNLSEVIIPSSYSLGPEKTVNHSFADSTEMDKYSTRLSQIDQDAYNTFNTWKNNTWDGLYPTTYTATEQTYKVGDEIDVTAIGPYALYDCSNLSKITIPTTVSSIGNYAFYNATNLAEINYNAISCADLSSMNYVFTNAGKNIDDGITVNIGSAVTKLPAYLFYPGNSEWDVPKITELLFEENSTCKSIGTYTFQLGKSLTNIELPESIEAINAGAFQSCTSLTDINIPNGVKTIGLSAFYNCQKLTKIDIPQSVTSIGQFAFYNCMGVTQINYNATNCPDFGSSNYVFYKVGQNNSGGIPLIIGDSVQHIPAYLFYPYYNEESYNPKITTMTIGTNVTSIGNYAFYGCRNLQQLNFNAKNCANLTSSNYAFYNAGSGVVNGLKVTIGAQVTKIPAYLFYPTASNRPRITTVTFNENSVCENIGNYAFYNADRLTEINIPQSVTSLGQYSFYGCSGLTSITIPEDLVTLGQYAFYNCLELTEINYESKLCSDLTSTNYVFYNAGKSGTGITVNIGSAVTQIPAYLFYPISYYYPNIINVIFENESVCKTIGNNAFAYSKITEITLPNSLTAINAGAFSECDSLTSVVIPESVGAISSYVFTGCSNLANVTLPSGATSIGSHSFSNCTSLASINIPSSVLTIGDYAFDGCSSLTAINIPEQLTSIGTYTFRNCELLETINYNAKACADLSSSNYVFYNAGQSGNGIHLNIGNNVISLPDYLCCPYSITNTVNNPKITKITIGEKLTSIAKWSLYNSIYVTEINFNATNFTNLASGNEVFYKVGNSGTGITLKIGANVTKIPDYMFNPESNPNYNPKITSMEFAEGSVCNSIGVGAFGYCDDLVNIIIPNTITSIGNSAFTGCVAATSVNYNATNCADLTESNYVFTSVGKNSGTLNVIIGDNVTRIPAYLFSPISKGSSDSITYIKELTIGTGVTSIGEYAFCNAKNVHTINFNPTNCSDLVNENYVFLSAGSNQQNGFVLNIGNNVTRIPAYLFYPGVGVAPSLKSLEFGQSSVCTQIGNNAFSMCSSLSSINLSTSITTIGNSAFNSCTALTSVAIPNSVNSLGVRVFYNCEKLSSVSIGTGISVINDYAFGACEALTSIVIPSNITTLSQYAFSYSGLTSVEIPNTVTSLGESVFSYCDDLVNVTIGTGVTEISKLAFSYCSSLQSVNIPNNVTVIGVAAFSSCDALTSITIPENVTSIASQAFQFCNALSEINYNAKACADGSSQNSIFYGGGKNGDPLVINIGANVTKIPNYLFNPYNAPQPLNATNVVFANGSVCQTIGEYSFAYANIVNINIPESVTSIGTHAFYNCSKLTTISLPRNITSIGTNAFYGCSAVTQIYYNIPNYADLNSSNQLFYNTGSSSTGVVVNIGANVTRIPAYLFDPCDSSSYNPKITNVAFEVGSVCQTIGEYSFAYLDDLTTINIPDSVTSIETYAFYNCSKLVNLNIPNELTIINTYTFYGCSSLTEITIPEGVTSIGASAFGGCAKLETIDFIATNCADFSSGNNIFYNAGKNGDGITVTIGANVTKIPAYLFYPTSYTSYLPKISTLLFEEGSNCTSIGSYAFNNCTNLTSITIPEKISSIGDRAFYGCTYVTEINYNITSYNDLTRINNVFYNVGKSAGGITVSIGANVTKIPAYLFNPANSTSYAPRITSVAFNQGSICESIGDYAFAFCANLINISIPNSVTSIGQSAFTNCTALANVIIPDSVEAINENLFYNCTGLTSVTIGKGVTSIGLDAFYGCTKLAELNYNATNCDDLTDVNEVFYKAGTTGTGIALTIGANVTKIPAYLFYSTNSSTSYIPCIASLTFEEGSVCESIGTGAFFFVRTLSAVTIPDSVTLIGDHAFDRCTSLATVNMGQNVQTIGTQAFYYCSLITNIIIPKSVTSIGSRAFYNCTGLANVYYTGASTEWVTLNKNIGSNNTDLTDKMRYYITYTNGNVSVINKNGATITASANTYTYTTGTNASGEAIATLTFHNNSDYKVVVKQS